MTDYFQTSLNTVGRWLATAPLQQVISDIETACASPAGFRNFQRNYGTSFRSLESFRGTVRRVYNQLLTDPRANQFQQQLGQWIRDAYQQRHPQPQPQQPARLQHVHTAVQIQPGQRFLRYESDFAFYEVPFCHRIDSRWLTVQHYLIFEFRLCKPLNVIVQQTLRAQFTEIQHYLAIVLLEYNLIYEQIGLLVEIADINNIDIPQTQNFDFDWVLPGSTSVIVQSRISQNSIRDHVDAVVQKILDLWRPAGGPGPRRGQGGSPDAANQIEIADVALCRVCLKIYNDTPQIPQEILQRGWVTRWFLA